MGQTIPNRHFVFLFVWCLANSKVAQSLHLTNASSLSSPLGSSEDISPTYIPSISNVTSSPEVSDANSWINGILNSWFVFAYVLSAATLTIIFSYLHNITLVNECILLHLYKDVVTILILGRIALVLKRITSLFSMNTQALMTMSPLTAKIIAFCLISVSLSLLILLSIISTLRMYMRRTMTLDPPMPREIPEELGIKIIRILIGVISIGYPAIIYPFGIYPKMYYDFSGVPGDNVPTLSALFSGSLILFIVIFLIMLIAEQCYKKASTQQMNSLIPFQVNYFLVSNTLLYGYICFEITFKFLDSNTRWLVFELLLSIFGVTTPAAVILSSKKVTTHSLKFFKDKYDQAFILSIYLIPTLLSVCTYGSLYAIYSQFGV